MQKINAKTLETVTHIHTHTLILNNKRVNNVGVDDPVDLIIRIDKR